MRVLVAFPSEKTVNLKTTSFFNIFLIGDLDYHWIENNIFSLIWIGKLKNKKTKTKKQKTTGRTKKKRKPKGKKQYWKFKSIYFILNYMELTACLPLKSTNKDHYLFIYLFIGMLRLCCLVQILIKLNLC